MSSATEIANRNLGKKIVNILLKKGVQITGVQASPLFDGDNYFSGTSYVVLIGEKVSAVRTFSQLKAMATSSWSADEYLQN